MSDVLTDLGNFANKGLQVFTDFDLQRRKYEADKKAIINAGATAPPASIPTEYLLIGGGLLLIVLLAR